MRCVFRSHYRDYKLNQAKIDDSQGMCGAESEYETCWSRLCSPDRSNVLRDVLRGLLVLIALAIVITVVFLICYFLINDIEHKEEELVDHLVKDFSAGGRLDPQPEFSTDDRNPIPPSDGDAYHAGDPARGDDDGVPQGGQDEHQRIDRIGDDKGAFLNHVPEMPSGGETSGSKGELPDAAIADFPPKTEVGVAGVGGSLTGSFLSDPELDDQTYDVITEFVQAESVNECVPLRLPICSGSMPWSLTAFPNIVNNNNMDELNESLKYFQSILVGSRCSSRATEYACAILEPACGPNGIPLPPCRSFCQDIVKRCSEFFVEGNSHNAAFLCGQFPDSKDPNVCVDISRAASDVLDAPPTNPSDQPPLENRAIPQEVTERTPSVDLPHGNDTLTDPLQKAPVTEMSSEKITAVTDDLNSEQVHKNRTEQAEAPMSKDATPAPEATAREDNEIKTADVTEPSVFICDHTKFLCTDGSDCLGDDAVCDGIQHCLDNSDELNCTKPEVKTPVDLIGEDSQPETTTYLNLVPKENNAPVDNTEDLPSRRPSLSDILSGSALVAVPDQPSPPPPTSSPKLSRASALTSRTKLKRKELESSKPGRNAFSSFGPFPFTTKPTTKRNERQQQSPKKLSLAALLSSSSIKPVSHTRGNGPQEESPVAELGEEEFSPPGQRSLSSLLSSNLPSFSSFPLRRRSQNECREVECNDGSCILLSQVGDGFRDCPDGSDENRNLISSKHF